MTKAIIKPLGGKAYTSIGHLPNSRLGSGDHCVNDGMARICTKKARDKFDRVIVQEKLDGSCVAVAKIDGCLHPLIRAGWPAESSPYEQHRLFSDWVWSNFDLFDDVLREGERICGEWLAQAHGTRYDLKHGPFVAFDIITGKLDQMPIEEFDDRVAAVLPTPYVVGYGPMPVKEAMALLGTCGWHGALDDVEGVVYRVERNGKVDFLAKYVRQDKVDGCYLPKVSGQPEVWNWRPAQNHEQHPAADIVANEIAEGNVDLPGGEA